MNFLEKLISQINTRDLFAFVGASFTSIVIYWLLGQLFPLMSQDFQTIIEHFTAWTTVLFFIGFFLIIFFHLSNKLNEVRSLLIKLPVSKTLLNTSTTIQCQRWLCCAIFGLNFIMYMAYLLYNYGSIEPRISAIGFNMSEICTMLYLGLLWFSEDKTNEIINDGRNSNINKSSSV